MAKWTKTRLKDVARINPDTRFPASGSVDFFPMEAIEENGGLTRGMWKPVADAGSYSQFSNGDILFAKVTPCFENKKCALAEGMERGVGLATTEVIVLRPSKRVDPRFLLYRLQARDFQQFGVNVMRGVGGLKRVPDRAVGAFEFLLPPMEEQKRIVDGLEREFDLLTRRAEAFGRKRNALSRARQALREAAVFGRDGSHPDTIPSETAWHGEIPPHWKIDRIASFFREATASGPATLPILSVSIHSGISDKELGDEDGARKVSRSEDKSLYKRVSPRDLVYNQMRAWQGGFGVARVEGLVSPAYVVARPMAGVNSEYIEHLLRSPSAIEEMRRRSRGIIDFRLRLYWDKFKDIRIPVPPQEEQDAIVRKLGTKLFLVDRQVALLDRLQAALADQRSALVDDLVTGAMPPPQLHLARAEELTAVA